MVYFWIEILVYFWGEINSGNRIACFEQAMPEQEDTGRGNHVTGSQGMAKQQE